MPNFIWESFSSAALAAFSSSLDGHYSCLNDSKINRPSFPRNKDWNIWEYMGIYWIIIILTKQGGTCPTMSHPSLASSKSCMLRSNIHKEGFHFVGHQSSKVTIFGCHFHSKCISFSQIPFFPILFTKTSSNHSSNRSFCSLLGFCFGGRRWFLSLTNWQKAGTNEMVQGMKTYPMRNHLNHNP